VVSIPFPLSSSPGASPQESAGRLINCYAEPLGKDVEANKQNRPAVVWRKCPVCRCSGIGNTGFRGHILVDNTLYAAWSGKVSKFTSGGVETS
jgi:hypothetical protein